MQAGKTNPVPSKCQLIWS